MLVFDVLTSTDFLNSLLVDQVENEVLKRHKTLNLGNGVRASNNLCFYVNDTRFLK